jgi:hypothetical protein
MAIRKTVSEKRQDAARARFPQLNTDFDGFLKHLLSDSKIAPEHRTINPTQAAALMSRERTKFYMGPAGCAKTSTGVASVLLRCLFEPGSHGLIARLDYNDLVGTTKRRAEEMLARLPPGVLLDRSKTAPEEWKISPIPYVDGQGRVHDEPSTIHFMGMKDNIGSWDFNCAHLDEADEVGLEQAELITTRLRTMGVAYYDLPIRPTPEDPLARDTRGYYSYMLTFNPPDVTHWLYTAATGMNYKQEKITAPWGELFVPNPRENIRNLPSGYYEDMAKNLSRDQQTRLIKGEWGATFPGQPVYRQFSKSFHGRRGLQYPEGATLFRFWDFGYRHPFCLWAVQSRNGRILFLREEMGENIHIRAWARHIKSMTNRYYPGVETIMDIGDIAVTQEKDTGSALAHLQAEGITMYYQRQSIDMGLTLVRTELERVIEGEAAIQIDIDKCPVTCAALSGGYHMKDVKALPHKDGYYDHGADTFRYGVVGLLNSGNLVTNTVPANISYDPAFDPRRS